MSESESLDFTDFVERNEAQTACTGSDDESSEEDERLWMEFSQGESSATEPPDGEFNPKLVNTTIAKLWCVAEARGELGGEWVLSQEEELQLASELLEVARIFGNLSFGDIRRLATEFTVLKRSAVATTAAGEGRNGGAGGGVVAQEPASPPSLAWLVRFLLQNQDVLLCVCSVSWEKCAARRAHTRVVDELRRYPFPSPRVYSVSDVPLCAVVPTPEEALVQPQKATVVTLCVCMSATGLFLPPMLVFPLPQGYQVMGHRAPDGALYCCSSRGRMSSELFLSWLEHFIHHTGCTPQQPVLLIVGDLRHHRQLAALQLCRERGVVLVGVPRWADGSNKGSSHGRNPMLPPDATFLPPLLAEFRAQCKAVTPPSSLQLNRKWHGLALRPTELAALLREAFAEVAWSEKGVEGFRRTGLYPASEEWHTPSPKVELFDNDLLKVTLVQDDPLGGCWPSKSTPPPSVKKDVDEEAESFCVSQPTVISLVDANDIKQEVEEIECVSIVKFRSDDDGGLENKVKGSTDSVDTPGNRVNSERQSSGEVLSFFVDAKNSVMLPIDGDERSNVMKKVKNVTSGRESAGTVLSSQTRTMNSTLLQIMERDFVVNGNSPVSEVQQAQAQASTTGQNVISERKSTGQCTVAPTNSVAMQTKGPSSTIKGHLPTPVMELTQISTTVQNVTSERKSTGVISNSSGGALNSAVTQTKELSCVSNGHSRTSAVQIAQSGTTGQNVTLGRQSIEGMPIGSTYAIGTQINGQNGVINRHLPTYEQTTSREPNVTVSYFNKAMEPSEVCQSTVVIPSHNMIAESNGQKVRRTKHARPIACKVNEKEKDDNGSPKKMDVSVSTKNDHSPVNKKICYQLPYAHVAPTNCVITPANGQICAINGGMPTYTVNSGMYFQTYPSVGATNCVTVPSVGQICAVNGSVPTFTMQQPQTTAVMNLMPTVTVPSLCDTGKSRDLSPLAVPSIIAGGSEHAVSQTECLKTSEINENVYKEMQRKSAGVISLNSINTSGNKAIVSYSPVGPVTTMGSIVTPVSGQVCGINGYPPAFVLQQPQATPVPNLMQTVMAPSLMIRGPMQKCNGQELLTVSGLPVASSNVHKMQDVQSLAYVNAGNGSYIGVPQFVNPLLTGVVPNVQWNQSIPVQKLPIYPQSYVTGLGGTAMQLQACWPEDSTKVMQVGGVSDNNQPVFLTYSNT